MNRPSRKERYHLFNNLVCLVKGLEGQYTTIDLQNEGCLTGKIIHVDGFMNLELEDAVFYDPRGFEHPFENFFVKARLIRYVHIPKNQPAVKVIEKQIQSQSIPQKTKAPSTFKVRRAQRYQKEILEGIAAAAGTSRDEST